MKTWFLNHIELFRMLSYAYLIAICLFWLFDNGIFRRHINWPILIIGAILTVQLVAKLPLGDGIIGFILLLLSLYMLLAVTSDVVDHFNGTKPVKSFWLYFGMGYGVFALATLSAFAITFGQTRPKENSPGLHSELSST